MARPAAPALPVTAQCSAVQCSAFPARVERRRKQLLPSHAPQPARPARTLTTAPVLHAPPVAPLSPPMQSAAALFDPNGVPIGGGFGLGAFGISGSSGGSDSAAARARVLQRHKQVGVCL